MRGPGQPVPLLRRCVRWRYLLITLVSAAAAASEVAGSWSDGTDWSMLRDGGHLLFSHAGLHTYVRVPGLQAGPLTLVVCRLLVLAFGTHAGVAGHALLIAELPVLVWLAERTAHDVAFGGAHESGRIAAIAAACGVFVAPIWGALAGATLHLDDGLALLGAALAMRYVVHNRPLAAAMCAGAAAAAKPWAIGALALLILLPSGKRAAFAVAAAVPVLSWLPFVFDPRNLTTAGHQAFRVSPSAPMRVLGLLPSVTPSWQRPAELLAIVVVAGVVAWRGGAMSAFAASMVARLLFEVATLGYYDVDTIVAVATADVATRRLPWRTALVWSVAEVGGLAGPTTSGWIRLVGLVVLLASYLPAVTTASAVSRPSAAALRGRREEPLLAS